MRGYEDHYMPGVHHIAKFDFDLNVDLRHLLGHWNTKQVNLALIISYESPTHARNQIILWDRIVQRTQTDSLNFL